MIYKSPKHFFTLLVLTIWAHAPGMTALRSILKHPRITEAAQVGAPLVVIPLVVILAVIRAAKHPRAQKVQRKSVRGCVNCQRRSPAT